MFGSLFSFACHRLAFLDAAADPTASRRHESPSGRTRHRGTTLLSISEGILCALQARALIKINSPEGGGLNLEIEERLLLPC